MVVRLLRFALRQRLLVIALGLAFAGVGAYVFMNRGSRPIPTSPTPRPW